MTLDEYKQYAREHPEAKEVSVDHLLQVCLAHDETGLKPSFHEIFNMVVCSRSENMAKHRYSPAFYAVIQGLASLEPNAPKYLTAKTPILEPIKRLTKITQKALAKHPISCVHYERSKQDHNSISDGAKLSETLAKEMGVKYFAEVSRTPLFATWTFHKTLTPLSQLRPSRSASPAGTTPPSKPHSPPPPPMSTPKSRQSWRGS